MVAQIALTLAMAAVSPEDYDFITDRAALMDGVVTDLVKQLADPKKGRAAAQRLIHFRRSAVLPLVAALRDKRPQVRYYAATVLGVIGDPRGAKALLRRLSDAKEDPMVRRVAARAMGQAEYGPATGVLVGLVRGTGQARRVRTAGAPSPPTNETRAANVPAAEDDEAETPEDVLPDEEFRFEVVRALAYIGAARFVATAHSAAAGEAGEANDILVAALSDSSARIRMAAAGGLGDARVISALGDLREALEDADGSVAAAAARAVGKLGKAARAAVPDLIDALERNDVRIRNECIRALVVITGFSFRTPAGWRKWREGRRDPAAKAGAPAGPKPPDFPLPAVDAREIFPIDRRAGGTPSPSDREESPARSGSPALRMPWEEDDDIPGRE